MAPDAASLESAARAAVSLGGATGTARMPIGKMTGTQSAIKATGADSWKTFEYRIDHFLLRQLPSFFYSLSNSLQCPIFAQHRHGLEKRRRDRLAGDRHPQTAEKLARFKAESLG